MQHGVLCSVALKYYTVNTQQIQKDVQKQITLLIQKGLKLQGNTTVRVQRAQELLTHLHMGPWLSTGRLALVPQSDQSFSSNSESSSESLYSTAMRLDKMVATSFPTGSRLASCSRCSCTFFSWIPIRMAAKRSLLASLMGGCAGSGRFASATGGPCIGDDDREEGPGGPGGGGGGPGGGGAVARSPVEGW